MKVRAGWAFDGEHAAEAIAIDFACDGCEPEWYFAWAAHASVCGEKMTLLSIKNWLVGFGDTREAAIDDFVRFATAEANAARKFCAE